ncbi:MAG: tetratricopeptide repeat protein [Ekhidna sp.]|nr:tetratricopeptide repeat protein [Ekhidna sp.]
MNPARINLLKEFIEKEPKDPFNKYALAMEYYEAAPNQSLELLRKLIANHPDYLPSYFKAAHIMWDQELWDEADTTFDVGIQIATKQQDQKALQELKSAYLNFQFDRD